MNNIPDVVNLQENIYSAFKNQVNQIPRNYHFIFLYPLKTKQNHFNLCFKFSHTEHDF